jgi:uncharacterized protein (TIGR01777 family)
VVRLVRRPAASAAERQWDPAQAIAPATVEGFDAVVHLSGESVAGRWTQAQKKKIRDSRVVSTRNLALALARTSQKPPTFLCASAIGYYGNRGDEVLTEESAPGEGFLAEVSREWEQSTSPAAAAGIRTVNLRIGLVLSREGGALKPMLLPFRLGLGGKIGSGRQWWSWIHIADLVSAVQHILETGQSIAGPVNLTAPNPVTNAEFTRALADALHRPSVLPIPAFAARLAFGEFADAGILASARVIPKALLGSRFTFRFPSLSDALKQLCS